MRTTISLSKAEANLLLATFIETRFKTNGDESMASVHWKLRKKLFEETGVKVVKTRGLIDEKGRLDISDAKAFNRRFKR